MAFDIKKIKNLFVQTSEQTDIPQNSTPAPAPVAGKPAETAPVSAGAFDQDVFNSLIKAIEEHNLPGEDYLEFLSALQSMQNIPLDDKLKVQTVLATLSTRGLTVQKIKESADYYKKVLSEEQKQFNTELNSHIQDQVKSKEKSIKELQELNTLKTQQITKLTQEINENQLKITEIQGHLKEADAKIKIAESNFNKTLEYIVNQIDANLNKINN